ncbi:MAG: hypothetical protein RLZZ76_764 [Candidatus Parcubacteria bacterium]|jgi:hypothetical protein
MRYTLISQIALVTLSLVLIFTFLKPSFSDIKSKQDDLFLYKDTVTKLEELNSTLRDLVATKNAFSENDLKTLNAFIPEKIDSLKVMRDIESVFSILKTPILSLTATEAVAPKVNEETEIESALAPVAGDSAQKVVYQDFAIKFVGSYETTKKILEMLERNETVLEVQELDINPVSSQSAEYEVVQNADESSFIVTLTVRAFGLSVE